MGRPTKTVRNNAICKAFKTGKTLRYLADKYGGSAARTQQIISANGLTSEDGGRFIAAKKREKENKKLRAAKAKIAAKKRQKQVKAVYGVSLKAYSKIKAEVGSNTLRAYRTNKRNITIVNQATYKGVLWKLNLKQWYDIWEASGKLNQRGRGGYFMSRKNRKKDFTPGNVHIISESLHCATNK